MLASLGLLYEYRTKWQTIQTNLGDDIVSYNVRNEYGRQMSGMQLAKEYTVPWRGERLFDFAVENGVSIEAYEEELDENIGKPILPIVGIVFHILATLYLISGLTYIISGGFIPSRTFLILGGLFFVISIILFLLAVFRYPDHKS